MSTMVEVKRLLSHRAAGRNAVYVFFSAKVLHKPFQLIKLSHLGRATRPRWPFKTFALGAIDFAPQRR